VDEDKDKKRAKPVDTAPGNDPESASDNSRNAALGEIYQRLYPEMRRPKPSQEAIAAALQAMQRLTIESDSEIVAETEAQESGAESGAKIICRICGHQNREGNKFCGACGLSLTFVVPETESSESSAAEHAEKGAEADAQGTEPEPGHDLTPRDSPPEVHPSADSPPGTHYYHHHYHHHYFQGGIDSGAAPRPVTAERTRETNRMRVAAAAKGEPMTRSEAAVRRLTQEWMLACNTRQLDELMELYAADALVLRSNLPPIRGAMAVREFFFSSLEAGLGEVALDPLRVEVAGDLAHEVGRYSALVPGTVGKRREERGKYLWVFAKQNSGDWKLISECWSSDQTLTNAEMDVPKQATASPSKTAVKKS
jgi:ketosteroid isomerase-like protein